MPAAGPARVRSQPMLDTMSAWVLRKYSDNDTVSPFDWLLLDWLQISEWGVQHLCGFVVR